jgi:hypothetical protein
MFAFRSLSGAKRTLSKPHSIYEYVPLGLLDHVVNGKDKNLP